MYSPKSEIWLRIREVHVLGLLNACAGMSELSSFEKRLTEFEHRYMHVHVRSLTSSTQLMCKCHRQKLFAYTLLSLLILQRNVRRDQRNQRYPSGGMQSLSKNQNRQKFSRKMQRNYGRGQWNDRKPAVSVC